MVLNSDAFDDRQARAGRQEAKRRIAANQKCAKFGPSPSFKSYRKTLEYIEELGATESQIMGPGCTLGTAHKSILTEHNIVDDPESTTYSLLNPLRRSVNGGRREPPATLRRPKDRVEIR